MSGAQTPEQRALEMESRCIELEARMQAVQRENIALREEVKRLKFTTDAVHRLAEENDELQRAYQELQGTLADVHHLLDDHERLEDELEEAKIQLQIAVDAIQTKEHEFSEMERNYAELVEMCEALMTEREEELENDAPNAGSNPGKSASQVAMHVYKSRLERSKHNLANAKPRSKIQIMSDISGGHLNSTGKMQTSGDEDPNAGPVFTRSRSRAHTRELSARLEQDVKQFSKALQSRCSLTSEKNLEPRRDGVKIRKKLPGFTSEEFKRLQAMTTSPILNSPNAGPIPPPEADAQSGSPPRTL